MDLIVVSELRIRQEEFNPIDLLIVHKTTKILTKYLIDTFVHLTEDDTLK